MGNDDSPHLPYPLDLLTMRMEVPSPPSDPAGLVGVGDSPPPDPRGAASDDDSSPPDPARPAGDGGRSSAEDATTSLTAMTSAGSCTGGGTP